MGEVYRARDKNLGRDMALKVSPETLSHDAERMARFQREGDVLAMGWQNDGRIIAPGWPTKVTLWRFYPGSSDKK